MKNQFPIVFLMSVASMAAAMAATPNADQADRFVRDLRAAIDAGPAQMATVSLRRLHEAKLSELETRSTRLFARDVKFDACMNAAKMTRSLWADQVAIAERGSTPKDIALLSQASIAAGVERHACSVAVDALRPQVPPECLAVVDLTNPAAKIPPRPAHCPKL